MTDKFVRLIVALVALPALLAFYTFIAGNVLALFAWKFFNGPEGTGFIAAVGITGTACTWLYVVKRTDGPSRRDDVE